MLAFGGGNQDFSPNVKPIYLQTIFEFVISVHLIPVWLTRDVQGIKRSIRVENNLNQSGNRWKCADCSLYKSDINIFPLWV